MVADLSFSLERDAVVLRIALDAAWPLDLSYDVCDSLALEFETWAGCGLENPPAITVSGDGTTIDLRWTPTVARDTFVESVRHTRELRRQIDSRLREGWAHGLRRRKVVRDLNDALEEAAAGTLAAATS